MSRPCRRCQYRGFQENPDTPGLCYCGHNAQDHGVFVPYRGGSGVNGCTVYRRKSVYENVLFDPSQDCECGTNFLGHQVVPQQSQAPLHLAAQEPASPWTLSATQATPSSAAWPAPTVATSSSALAPNSVAPTGQRISPFSPATSTGVPQGSFQNSYSNTGHPTRRVNTQRTSRVKPYFHGGASHPTNSRSTVTPIEVFLVPYGPNLQNIELECRDIFDSPELRIPENRCHEFFATLLNHGLHRIVTLQNEGGKDNRQIIHNAISSIVQEKHFQIPADAFIPLSNPLGELGKAPWSVLKGGNHCARGQLLKYVEAAIYGFDNVQNIRKLYIKINNPISPTPPLLVCLGGRINGPIPTDFLGCHPCYASRVMKGIFTSPHHDDLQARDGCFPTCPGQESYSALASSSALLVSHYSPQDLITHPTVDNASSLLPVAGPSSFASHEPFSFPSFSAQNQNLLPASNASTSSSNLLARSAVQPPSNIPAPTSVVNWSSFLDPSDWIEGIRQPRSAALGQQDGNGLDAVVSLRITAPTEESAAQALLNAFIAHFAGQRPENLPHVQAFDHKNLAFGRVSVAVGHSLGDGVFRAVYHRSLMAMAADAASWKLQDSVHGNVTWHTRPHVPTNGTRLAKARAAGALLAFGYVRFQVSFAPISIWMSWLAATSFNSLKNIDLMKAIDRDLGQILSAWLLDRNVPLQLHRPNPATSTILHNYLETSSASLEGLDENEREAYENEVFAKALFATSHNTLIEDREISAFKEAFNMKLYGDINLCETLGPEPLLLIQKMQGGRLISAPDLIEHLRYQRRYQRASDVHDTLFSDDDLHMYSIKLSRYLRGVGHPLHEKLPDTLISPEVRAAVASDPLYRARNFLEHATGSTVVPMTGDWVILIQFTAEASTGHHHNRPANRVDVGSWAPTYPPFFFRTCSQVVNVFVGKDLKDSLNSEDPETDTIASGFDAWVHQQLFSPPGSDWSAL